MLLLHLRRISVAQGGSSNFLLRLYKALVIQSNLAHLLSPERPGTIPIYVRMLSFSVMSDSL